MTLKVILFAVLGIAAFGFLISYKPSLDYKSNALISPQASAVPETSEVRSLEGTLKLVMTRKENSDETATYSFTTSDASNKKTLIFGKTVGKGEMMLPAHNSWSPNDKYVFIEDIKGSLVDYLLFKANGESFASGEKYLNVTALFNQKVKNYNLKAITGWDDPVLMHVITVNGPLFWFDVTTQSFIQLAR